NPEVREPVGEDHRPGHQDDHQGALHGRRVQRNGDDDERADEQHQPHPEVERGRHPERPREQREAAREQRLAGSQGPRSWKEGARSRPDPLDHSPNLPASNECVSPGSSGTFRTSGDVISTTLPPFSTTLPPFGDEAARATYGASTSRASSNLFRTLPRSGASINSSCRLARATPRRLTRAGSATKSTASTNGARTRASEVPSTGAASIMMKSAVSRSSANAAFMAGEPSNWVLLPGTGPLGRSRRS